jgi:hypothetical protein
MTRYVIPSSIAFAGCAHAPVMIDPRGAFVTFGALLVLYASVLATRRRSS